MTKQYTNSREPGEFGDGVTVEVEGGMRITDRAVETFAQWGRNNMSVTKVEVKFRPVDRDTLKLIHTTYQQEGDAAANYGRLMSAAMVAGAIIGLTKEQIAQHAEVCAEHAIRAVETRTDIFGGKSSNENHR